jgi:mannose-6-phosphate isomerase-like protein (cupin superfamily)
MSATRSLQRKLLFYRGVVVVLLVLLAMLAVKLKRIAAQVGDFGQAGQTWVVDLDERVRVIEEEFGAEADFSETYLSTPVGSVHLHALGRTQVTPLHLHPASDEVTVIASGTAHVTHAWGVDGGVATRMHDFPAGSVVATPRGCAHEWENRSPEHLLFNLVFTSPRFSGNFYVRGDDPRIRAGAEPTSPVAGAASGLVHLSELGGRLLTVAVDTHWRLPRTTGAPVVIWVQSGEGSIAGQAVKANCLVHVEGEAADIAASSRLALLLFDVTGRALP